MNRDYDYSALASEQEATQCSEVMGQSFVVDPKQELDYLHEVGLSRVRVVRWHGEIVGGLALLPMGQWFGGRRVAMTGVGSVAISPHLRGQGAATALMTSMIEELASQGVALSVLYPAVQALYQKVGYGFGGSRYTWQITTEHIDIRQPTLSCYPQKLQSPTPEWLSLQQAMAHLHNGCLDRHELLWKRLFRSPGEGRNYRYHIGSDHSPQGYLITYQERDSRGTTLTIRDWAAPSLEAMRSLWTFLYEQRSQVETIQWAGGAVDPLALALPEQRASSTDQTHWMVRIVDLQQALTQRGYPRGIAGELHLGIEDPLIPQNNGKFVLEVRDGAGQLNPGGQGNLSCPIQQLAPLFTGMRSAQELHALGQLDASPETLPLATAIFSGPSPWMPDFF